jgi:hypothetical protein
LREDDEKQKTERKAEFRSQNPEYKAEAAATDFLFF